MLSFHPCSYARFISTPTVSRATSATRAIASALPATHPSLSRGSKFRAIRPTDFVLVIFPSPHRFQKRGRSCRTFSSFFNPFEARFAPLSGFRNHDLITHLGKAAAALSRTCNRFPLAAARILLAIADHVNVLALAERRIDSEMLASSFASFLRSSESSGNCSIAFMIVPSLLTFIPRQVATRSSSGSLNVPHSHAMRSSDDDPVEVILRGRSMRQQCAFIKNANQAVLRLSKRSGALIATVRVPSRASRLKLHAKLSRP